MTTSPLQPHLTLGSLDADWCLEQARAITSQFPVTEIANASGKFFSNYRCWHFHKSSSLDLIRALKSVLDERAAFFQEIYGRSLDWEFAALTYVKDASEPICNRHMDGYFFNGQAHLTILGNASLEVELHDGTVEYLRPPNGSIWYFNGSSYFHKIRPTSGERFELCVGISPRSEYVKRRLSCVSEEPERFLIPFKNDWYSFRDHAVEHVRLAVRNGTASNPTVAAFSSDYDHVVRDEWIKLGFGRYIDHG